MCSRYFTSLLDTLHRIDALRQINALTPSFHMIARIQYGNRTLNDRYDRCDCNRRDRKIANSTIVAIVKSTILRSLQTFEIARITTAVLLSSLRSSVAGLRSVPHVLHDFLYPNHWIMIYWNAWRTCSTSSTIIFSDLANDKIVFVVLSSFLLS